MTPKPLLIAATLLTATLVPALGHAAALRNRRGAYELQVLVGGHVRHTYQSQGRSYILGELGARYVLRVWNHSGRRVEADVSVDGRDVLTGKPADFQAQRGYLISPWSYVDIDGWRISTRQAAAFRFSTVPDSYAARTGSAREVGVIGVAVFPERYVPPRPPVYVAPPRPPSYASDKAAGRAATGSAARDEEPEDTRAEGPRPASSAPRAVEAKRATRQREGLATAFGEAVNSRVTEVPFARADPLHPAAVLGLHYDDARGLVAMGVDLDWRRPTEARLRQTADPFPEVDPRYAQPPPGWSR